MGRKFTKEEDDFLRANCLTIPAKRMATLLGRREGVARQRMKVLGIEVPDEIKEKFRRDSWIAKGTEPPNKGKNLEEYLSDEQIEKIKSTQFKQGLVPHNTKPVGSERFDPKDGYVYIKADGKRGYVLKHRLLWEQHHGPIPKGMNVQFINCNKSDIRIDNLELVSRAGNMKQNSIHNYGPEVAKAYQLIGAINRKINQQSQ